MKLKMNVVKELETLMKILLTIKNLIHIITKILIITQSLINHVII